MFQKLSTKRQKEERRAQTKSKKLNQCRSWEVLRPLQLDGKKREEGQKKNPYWGGRRNESGKGMWLGFPFTFRLQLTIKEGGGEEKET